MFSLSLLELSTCQLSHFNMFDAVFHPLLLTPTPQGSFIRSANRKLTSVLFSKSPPLSVASVKKCKIWSGFCYILVALKLGRSITGAFWPLWWRKRGEIKKKKKKKHLTVHHVVSMTT